MLFNSQHFFGCGERKASDLYLQIKVVLVTVAVASAVIASILLSAVAEFFKLSAIADLASLIIVVEATLNLVVIAALTYDLTLTLLIVNLNLALDTSIALVALVILLNFEDVLLAISTISGSGSRSASTVSGVSRVSVLIFVATARITLISATAAQGVINLTLLAVVAISKVSTLALKGTVTPFLAWVLENISEDASSGLVIELTTNLTAAFSGATAFLVFRFGLDDALEVSSEKVIDEVTSAVSLDTHRLIVTILTIILIVTLPATTAISVISVLLAAVASSVLTLTAISLLLYVIITAPQAGEPVSVSAVSTLFITVVVLQTPMVVALSASFLEKITWL